MSKRRKKRFVPAWLLAIALVLPLADAAPADPLRLERAVLVTRHGVRSPLRANRILRDLTRRDWPVWPGGPGEMTPHGAEALAAMADYVRGRYADAALLPTAACPAAGTVAVWSDVADRRTRESGDIWASRLAPGCHLVAGHAPASELDALFDSKESGACRVGLAATTHGLWRASRPAALLGPAQNAALVRLQAIVAPRGCGLMGRGICLKPSASDSRVTLAAKLALGGTIAEAIYLQYVQGFPEDQVGWGGAGDAATIAAIMPAHDADLTLRKRTPALAARHGHVLARAILAYLDGGPPPSGIGADARLLVFAGHDTNLLYLASLMGLEWRFPNQPSVTAPDTTLAFEVWRDPGTGERVIRVKVYAQSLDQLRRSTPLGPHNAPDTVDVVPDVCGAARCTVDRLVKGVTKRLRDLCG